MLIIWLVVRLVRERSRLSALASKSNSLMQISKINAELPYQRYDYLANSSIARIMQGQAPHVWTGPILATMEPEFFQNLDNPAFRTLCNFFRSYSTFEDPNLEMTSEVKNIKGVRINGVEFGREIGTP